MIEPPPYPPIPLNIDSHPPLNPKLIKNQLNGGKHTENRSFRTHCVINVGCLIEPIRLIVLEPLVVIFGKLDWLS